MRKEIIHENYEKIDIMKDFWKIHQILREDHYLLDSIKVVFDGTVTLDSHEKCIENNTTMDKYICDIDVLNGRYIKLDDKLLDDNKEMDEVASDLDDISVGFANDFLDIYSSIKESIELSSDIQKLLYDMLIFIKHKREKLNQISSETCNDADTNYIFNKDKDNVNKLLHRSVEEDKIMNYELVYSNKDKEGINEFRKLVNKYGNLNGGNDKKIMFRKTNGKYNIKRLIDEVVQEYQHTITIQNLISDKNKERNVNRLNKNLFILNCVAPIIGVISTLPILYKVYQNYGWKKPIVGTTVIVSIIIILYKKMFCKNK